MSLAEERALLKKIHKLKTMRQKVVDFESYDEEIKQKKTAVSTLRTQIQEQRVGISELQTELQTVNTALELGCDVESLVGTKVACPTDKLGRVIGRKGQNVQQLRQTAHVDIVQSDIRLVGTKDSLEAAKSNLDRVIQQTEETVEVPVATHNYLTSSKISALPELYERHPDVRFQISRLADYRSGDSDLTIRVRGLAADIQAFRNNLQSLELVQVELSLTSRESGLVVGKGGATIASLVEKHQTAIEVHKSDNNGAVTTVIITGPVNQVAAARTEIETMCATNRDGEETLAMHPYIKSVLLLNGGAGVNALHKQVNEATRKALAGSDGSSSSYVSVNLHDNGVAIKATPKALKLARAMVKAELERIESLFVTIQVDPIVIPVMIGKRGQGVKALKGDTKTVNVEFDHSGGQVVVCGLQKEEVEKVAAAVGAVKAVHFLERVRLDCDEDSEAYSFAAQFRNFLRAPVSKQVIDLVFMTSDDSLKQILLRGKPENVAKASALVYEFLAQNYAEELCVTSEDMTALLVGGKASKIVGLAEQTGVNLSTDRDRQVLMARGEKKKVTAALKAVREFLYGSDDVAVSKIELANDELMGVVIGKGGKHKNELQEKFGATSIIFHRTEAVITLRGPTKEVEGCRVEIMKLILDARISRTTELTDKQVHVIQKSKFCRRVGQMVPVQVVFSSEKKYIVFRGSMVDVQEAQALLKEQLEGIRESRMRIGGALFRKLKDACSDPSHLDRIQIQSQAKVTLDNKTEEIVVAGKRQNVKLAKDRLLNFLDFLLGPSFCRCEVDEDVCSYVGKPSFLADIAAKSGAQVVLDRDLNALLILSSKPEQVQEASDMFDAKVVEGRKLVYVLQLDRSEDWLVSSIIGKSGVSIKKLRKQTECTIDVDSNERKIVVSAQDALLVAKAKTMIDELVDKARKECVFVTIPEKDMPAFVGRSGTKICEFELEHGVDVQIMKKLGPVIRITGDVDKVQNSQKAVEEWLAVRDEARKEAESALETKRLRRDQVPAVIGPKGSVIQSLEKEFGCRIEIDRKTSTVTVRGGSKDKRSAVLEKIDKVILEDQQEQSGDEDAEEGDLQELNPEEVVADPETKAEKEVSELPSKDEFESSPRGAASLTIEAGDFPELVGGKRRERNTSASKESWSSVASVDSDISFIGDIIEEASEMIDGREEEDVLEQKD